MCINFQKEEGTTKVPLSSEAQYGIREMNPKSRYCPIVLFVPWYHDWNCYVKTLPSVCSLHLISSQCCVLRDAALLVVRGMKTARCNHAPLNASREMLSELSVPFLLTLFVEGTITESFGDHLHLFCTSLHVWLSSSKQTKSMVEVTRLWCHSHQRKSTQENILVQSYSGLSKVTWESTACWTRHWCFFPTFIILWNRTGHENRNRIDWTWNSGSLWCFLWLMI